MKQKMLAAILISILCGCGGTRIQRVSNGANGEQISFSFDEAASFGVNPVSDVRCCFVDVTGTPVAKVEMVCVGRGKSGWQYVCDAPERPATGYFIEFVNSNNDRKRVPENGEYLLDAE